MNLTSFVLLGCALACPVGMGAMMWLMGRGMRSTPNREERDD